MGGIANPPVPAAICNLPTSARSARKRRCIRCFCTPQHVAWRLPLKAWSLPGWTPSTLTRIYVPPVVVRHC